MKVFVSVFIISLIIGIVITVLLAGNSEQLVASAPVPTQNSVPTPQLNQDNDASGIFTVTIRNRFVKEQHRVSKSFQKCQSQSKCASLFLRTAKNTAVLYSSISELKSPNRACQAAASDLTNQLNITSGLYMQAAKRSSHLKGKQLKKMMRAAQSEPKKITLSATNVFNICHQIPATQTQDDTLKPTV